MFFRRATSTAAGLSLFSDAIRPAATRAERAKKIFSAALSALLQAPSWRGVTRLFSAVSGARLLSVTYVAAQGIGYPKVVQCVRRGCDMIFSNFSAYFGPTRRSAPAPPPILAPHFGPTRRASVQFQFSWYERRATSPTTRLTLLCCKQHVTHTSPRGN